MALLIYNMCLCFAHKQDFESNNSNNSDCCTPVHSFGTKQILGICILYSTGPLRIKHCAFIIGEQGCLRYPSVLRSRCKTG